MIFVNFFMNNIYFWAAFCIFFLGDFILGFSNAYKNNKISSKKMKMSIPKFIGYNVVIMSCITFDVLIFLGSDIEFMQRFSPFAKISIVLICFNEFISILENADKLGLFIPKILKKLIEMKNDI